MALLAERGNRVLYVDPCYASRSERLRPKHGYRNAYAARVRQVSENLWVMTPPLSFPLGRFRLSRTLSDVWLARGVLQFMREKGFGRPLLWIYPPTVVNVVDEIPHRTLIYEVVDDYAEYPTHDPATRRYIRECEREMLKRADLVFVTSKELLPGRSELNPNAFLSPNGVDIELFSKAQDPSLGIPEDIRKVPRPILGFVGGIAPWTDLDMVLEVALRKPSWSIVLIGPVDPGINLRRFEGVKNIHFLGRQPAEMLPGYLKGIDVCLNLFRKIPLTRAVNPLKVYEYLAAGKPVVSTPMPEVQKFGRLVSIGHDPDSFIAAIQRALTSTDDPAIIETRQRAVAAFSWDRIFDEVMSRVIELIPESRSDSIVQASVSADSLGHAG